MSANQSFDPNLAPIGVDKENSPDPDDPDAAPIVDLGESGIEPDPAYKDDVPVGTRNQVHNIDDVPLVRRKVGAADRHGGGLTRRASGELLLMLTTAPPGGAAPLRSMNPLPGEPPVTESAWIVSALVTRSGPDGGGGIAIGGA